MIAVYSSSLEILAWDEKMKAYRSCPLDTYEWYIAPWIKDGSYEFKGTDIIVLYADKHVMKGYGYVIKTGKHEKPMWMPVEETAAMMLEQPCIVNGMAAVNSDGTITIHSLSDTYTYEIPDIDKYKSSLVSHMNAVSRKQKILGMPGMVVDRFRRLHYTLCNEGGDIILKGIEEVLDHSIDINNCTEINSFYVEGLKKIGGIVAGCSNYSNLEHIKTMTVIDTSFGPYNALDQIMVYADSIEICSSTEIQFADALVLFEGSVHIIDKNRKLKHISLKSAERILKSIQKRCKDYGMPVTVKMCNRIEDCITEACSDITAERIKELLIF